VNYHFQTKEHLIEICVQRMIGRVIASFQPLEKEGQTDAERLAGVAAQVFEFLFENPAVSRISILGDLTNPAADSNSVRTMKGFSGVAGEAMEEDQKQLMVFVLTCAMQEAFLWKNESKSLTGYDLGQKAGREEFIRNLVRMLFTGGLV
ncbi:MAG: TetR/AcrR family transcriptional regulator, partial [Eubacterium sp.]